MAALTAREFAEFNGLLASAVERGLALDAAVDLLAGHAARGRTRAALEAVAGALREGATLPAALEAAPQFFPADYVALVRAGLEGERLADILRASESYHSMRARLARRTRMLCLYVALGLLLCEAGLAFVVSLGRRFEKEFEETFRYGPHLVAGVAEWFLGHPAVTLAVPAVLLGLALGLVALVRFGGAIGRLEYWIPVWGRLQRSRAMAQLSTVLALRLRAGAPAAEALRSAAAAMGNRWARRALRVAAARVEEGENLSNAFFYDAFFPRTLAWAVSLGEARGDVPGTFTTFARIHAAELERNSEILFQVLTPLTILAMGNLVFFTVMLLVFPIFRILDFLTSILPSREPASDVGRWIVSFLVATGVNLLFLAALAMVYVFVTRRRAKVFSLVEHLAALAKRGMPLQTGLRLLGQDLGGMFGVRLAGAARRLEDGASMTEALAASPAAFPPLVRGMAALGERSGNAAGFLEELRRSYRRLVELPSQAVYPFLYPILLSLAINLALTFVALAIRPRMGDIFGQIHVARYDPWWAWLMVANEAVLVLCVFLAAFVFLGGASIHFRAPLLRALRRPFDRLSLALPVFGGLVRDGSLQLFSLGTGLLLRAGARLPEAVRAAGEVESNEVLRRRFARLAAQLQEGGRLSDHVRRERLLPEDLLWFVETGEAAGNLPDQLLQAALHYETKSRLGAQLAIRAVIPFFVVLNGALVLGTCVLAFLPIRDAIRSVIPW